jgi:hypothetical protein
VRNNWTELPEDDPIFSGGVRLVFGEQSPPDLTAAADEDLEFVSPSVPGRRVRMIRSVEESK